jgi:hypothetical protein
MALRIRVLASFLAFATCACSGPTYSIDLLGGGDAATCGAAITEAGVCTLLSDRSNPITPTCAPGTIPSGAGGPIADGTYVLTAQTYFGATLCPSDPISATLTISGTCYQEIARADFTEGGLPPFTASFVVTPEGSQVAIQPTCVDYPGGMGNPQTLTYTATGSTFTLFNSQPPTSDALDRIDFFTKR